MDIYDQINAIRTNAIRAAHEAGGLNEDYPLSTHLVVAGTLTEDDWTEDATYGRTLGNPESDWSVTVDGSEVTVWAEGDAVATGTIARSAVETAAVAVEDAQSALRLAVRAEVESGRSVADVARQAGVTRQTVYRWLED